MRIPHMNKTDKNAKDNQTNPTTSSPPMKANSTDQQPASKAITITKIYWWNSAVGEENKRTIAGIFLKIPHYNTTSFTI
jgi:hypothetical protein